jgi:glycosyltransferase involved in cell wall biosynthesis
MTTPWISIVVPAYNEEIRLKTSLNKIDDYLRHRQVSCEIVVVDDGSSDATAEIALSYGRNCAEHCSVRVLQNDRNRGKGYSVRRGMIESKGAYALLTDADLSSPIDEMPKLEEYVVQKGYDAAIGSRDVPGSQVEVRQSWMRENAGKVFNRIVRLTTGLPFWDTQCGFKLFDMRTCRDIFRKQRLERFAFDVEVLYIAKKWKLRTAEVPVIWRHAEGSKVRLFPDAPLTGLDLLNIRWSDLRGLYEPPQLV